MGEVVRMCSEGCGRLGGEGGDGARVTRMGRVVASLMGQGVSR